LKREEKQEEEKIWGKFKTRRWHEGSLPPGERSLRKKIRKFN